MPLDWTELEELGFTAFPAIVEEREGPLVCRASGGFNYRNSSVTLTRAIDQWETVLEKSRAFCVSHGIETVLRIPEPIAPTGPLRGWERFRVARVLLREPCASDTSGARSLAPAGWNDWITFQHMHRGETSDRQAKFETVMRRLEGRNLPYLWTEDGRTVAAALVAPNPRADGLMNMLVDARVRGNGIGGRFLDSLLAESDRQNRPMWLQVLSGNSAAEKLYMSRGFSLAYDYGYYRPLSR